MRLALWDEPAAEFMASGVRSGAVPDAPDIVKGTQRETTERLLEGDVDVALVPTLMILSNPKAFDVLPGAALSTWSYPYARLILRGGLEQIASVAYNPEHVQEALLARIVLKEHYRREPEFVPVPSAETDQLRGTAEQAVLVVGSDVPLLSPEHTTLDLGQEWFELANYPMAWGLFAARKDEAVPAMVRLVRQMARTAEEQRRLWLQAQEMPPELHAFFTDSIRLRFDDMVTASLTEFRQYLFYYEITEEIADVPLYSLPEDEPGEEGPTPLI